MRLKGPVGGPNEALQERAPIRHDGRKRVVRSTQNALRDLHLVEVPGGCRGVCVMRRVFARRRVVRDINRLRCVTKLMHMRRRHPA